MKQLKRIVYLVLLLSLATARLEAATYYVSQSGSDVNSCLTAQSTTQILQKLTISAGVACLSAGDTLYIHTGTYTGTINSIDSNATTVNGGTDYGAGAVTIAAYPAETVTIAVGTGGGNAITMASTTQQYIIFDRLILDGTGMSGTGGDEAGGLYQGSGSAHIRFQNGEVKNFPWEGVHAAPTAGGDLQVLTSHIHHNGSNTTPHTHNIYLTSSGNLVEGCELDHGAGNGVVLYNGATPPSSNVIRKNFIHDNAVYFESEVTIGGSDNQFYDNIVAGSGSSDAIYVAFSSPTNTLIYNNTFVLTNGPRIESGAVGTVLKNNIIRTTANAGAGSITDGGTGTVTGTNYTADPTFTNGGGSFLLASDFQIQSGSGPKDAGTTLATVADDYAGVSRPQGPSYDIGAYESVVASSNLIQKLMNLFRRRRGGDE